MGILGIGRGLILAVVVLFALAILKRLIIAFGLLFAFLKFGIILVFLVLLASIGFAIIRGWSEKKSGVKET